MVDLCFRGSVSRIGGMSLSDLQRETESLWTKGFPEKALSKLEDYGYIQSKSKGEFHSNNQVRLEALLAPHGRACHAGCTKHQLSLPVLASLTAMLNLAWESTLLVQTYLLSCVPQAHIQP